MAETAKARAVIPGRAKGASPESITPGHAAVRRIRSARIVVMDSGLRAARGPGM